MKTAKKTAAAEIIVASPGPIMTSDVADGGLNGTDTPD